MFEECKARGWSFDDNYSIYHMEIKEKLISKAEESISKNYSQV